MKFRKQCELNLMKSCLNLEGKTLDVGGEGNYDSIFNSMHSCNINDSVGSPYGRSKFKTCNLNTDNLPYRNNSFDSVLLTHVLEHIENIFFVINECLRVLKKGGRLFISIPNPHSLQGVLKYLFFGEVRVVPVPFKEHCHINIVLPYIIKEVCGKHKLIHESYNGGVIPLFRINIKKSKLFGKNYTLVVEK